MRIVFFGNADFGCSVLESLVASEHDVVGVVSNKDKKSGRNLNFLPTPIKKTSKKLNLNLIEINNLNNPSLIESLKALSPDIFIVIAYKIMPKQVYSIPYYGSVNLHASLLPAYKGAAPIQRAIINGEKYTGLSSFFLNNSIDGGELINQMKIGIDEEDSFENVWNNLYDKSSEFMLMTLRLVLSSQTIISNTPVKESYAYKIKKEELRIDWKESNSMIHNKVRAFSPIPSMYTSLADKRIKILKTKKSNYSNDASLDTGSIVVNSSKMLVQCGEGFLEIIKLKPDSKKDIKAIDFINGFLKSTKPSIDVFK